MRIATYNVEWFDKLFSRDGGLRRDSGWSARWDVTCAQQGDALGVVFRALDADAIMVIEAPDAAHALLDRPALEHFTSFAGIRARRALTGFANDTRQEITLLYDPDRLDAHHDPRSDGAPRFDTVFRIDLDVDARVDRVTWSKPPLEVALDTPDGPLRLIGTHAKSKNPHGARSDAERLRRSIANRRKQLAQCIWLRARIDAHLVGGDALIVLGDVNDGPGLDTFEQLFGRSSVEILLGEGDTALVDPHALVGGDTMTARFWRADQKAWLEAMLDYIMVSRDLAARQPSWRIWHPFRDTAIAGDPRLAKALLSASDHFPVTLDLPEHGSKSSAI